MATKKHVAVAQSESFFMSISPSKLTAFGFAMEMVKASQKNPFPHVVSTPREVGGLHHHGLGTWSVSVLHASTATASQQLVERRAVDRAEQIYAGLFRPLVA
jgi:hypothetical protein